MKKASVADLRNKFSLLSEWLESGESVTIRKRGRDIAVLTPLKRRRKKNLSWPDFEQRWAKVFSKQAKGISTSKLLIEARGDR